MYNREEADKSINSLIESITEEDNRKIDLGMSLELADRINSNPKDCKEAVQVIIKRLGSSNSEIRKNTIDLLETLVKNCNERFQYEISCKKFCELALKLLKKRRGKTNGFIGKLIADKDQNRPYIEKKLLYLIQLWADTFMMHEDDFKPIMECYRLLRKEGVQFPPRDPNEKFMINFKGIVSPVFLVMENNTSNTSTTPNPNSSNINKNDTSNSSRHNTNTPTPKPETKNQPIQQQYQREPEINKEDIYYISSEGSSLQISSEEIQIIKGSMSILKEITENAIHIDEMKSEIAIEILDDLAEVKKKLAIIIKKEKLMPNSQRKVLFDLDYEINECIATYNSKCAFLKEQNKNANALGSRSNRSNENFDDLLGNLDNPKKGKLNDDDDFNPEFNHVSNANNDEVDYVVHKWEEEKTEQKPIVSLQKPIVSLQKQETYPGTNKMKTIINPPPGWKKPIEQEDLIDLNDNNQNGKDSTSLNQNNTNNNPKTNEITDLFNVNFGSLNELQANNSNNAGNNDTISKGMTKSQTFDTNPKNIGNDIIRAQKADQASNFNAFYYTTYSNNYQHLNFNQNSGFKTHQNTQSKNDNGVFDDLLSTVLQSTNPQSKAGLDNTKSNLPIQSKKTENNNTTSIKSNQVVDPSTDVDMLFNDDNDKNSKDKAEIDIKIDNTLQNQNLQLYKVDRKNNIDELF